LSSFNVEPSLSPSDRASVVKSSALVGIPALSSTAKFTTPQGNSRHLTDAEYTPVKSVAALLIQCHESFFVFDFHVFF
jgi:hypothetical protein